MGLDVFATISEGNIRRVRPAGSDEGALGTTKQQVGSYVRLLKAMEQYGEVPCGVYVSDVLGWLDWTRAVEIWVLVGLSSGLPPGMYIWSYRKSMDQPGKVAKSCLWSAEQGT